MTLPIPLVPPLDVTWLTSHLPTAWRSIEVHPEVASTNALAVAAARPWSVIVAEHQTAGRGRLDRSWQAPRGASLTFSATVPAPPGAPGWVPLLAGLATAEALTAVSGLSTTLKWPNDVLVPAAADRKVAGILCEYRPPQPGVGALVVIGIGINVHQSEQELPVPTATSLALAGAHDVDRHTLLVAVLRRLADRYAAVLAGAGDAEQVHAAYRAACATIGSRVRLQRSDAPDVDATAIGVDDEGALLVDDGTGLRAYAAGDVVHLRPASELPGLT